MNTRTNMSSILLESRTESEPSVASQIHDCTRELMDATNVIDFRAKECVEIVRAAVDANVSKVEMAKKDVNEKRKREVENSACKIKDEGTNLEGQSNGLKSLKRGMEETQVDLRQSSTEKAHLAEGVIVSAATRDLEKKICGKKKLVVDDHLDTVDKVLSVYQTHLGLSIGRNPNGDLEMTFTRLDPRSPSRSFSIILHLHSNSKLYSFVSSSPELDFQPLVNSLNRTNNLKKFVCRVRRTFIENFKH